MQDKSLSCMCLDATTCTLKKKLGEDLVTMKQTTTMRMCLSNTSPCKYVDVYATIAHDWE